MLTPATPSPQKTRRIYRAILFGIVIMVFIADVHRLVHPLHARGWYPDATALLDSIASILEQPAREMVFLALGHSYVHFQPLLSLPLTAGFYTLVAFIWMSLLCRRTADSQNANSIQKADVGLSPSAAGAIRSRRRFLSLSAQTAVAGGIAGAFAYGGVFEPRNLHLAKFSFPLRGLPAELHGLRIVQITDVHHGPWLSESDLQRIVRHSNALRPDLVVLTGDYVLREKIYAAPAVRALSELRASIGIVATLGNHDWYESAELLRDSFTGNGIRMLDNTRVCVTRDRRLTDQPAGGLCVAGVGDLWCDQQLYDQALAGIPTGTPRILLSHNPDVAEDPRLVTCGHRVDLMLSGHTHGGQIKLPGLPAFVTYSQYGQKYLHGLAQGPVCPVFVCAGVGMSRMPVRVGVPPEIACFELLSIRGVKETRSRVDIS